MSYRNYSVANGHIVDPLGNGDFKTITSALASTTSGNTIFIKPGTYTENLTLVPGVNLTAWNTDSNGAVIINGKCSYSGSGTINISGINLKTNSDYVLAVTGSSASVINFYDCYFDISNNTAINYTSSSSSSSINIYDSNGDIKTTGIAIFTSTASGNISFYRSVINNSGGSVTPSTCSGAGQFLLYHSNFYSGFQTSGTTAQFLLESSYIDASGVSGIEHNSSNSFSSYCHNSFIGGASSPAITLGADGLISLNNCVISSSNTNALSGSGFINLSEIVFSNTSSTIDPNLTLQELVCEIGELHLYKSLAVPYGGTGSNLFNPNGVVISNTTGTGPLSSLTLADGEIVIGNTIGVPVNTTLTAGTGISIANGHGSITISTSPPSWTLITSTSISGTPSSISFTSANIANYNNIMITFDNVAVSTASTMSFGCSTDGGSTYAVNLYGLSGAAESVGFYSRGSVANTTPFTFLDVKETVNIFSLMTIQNFNQTIMRPFQFSAYSYNSHRPGASNYIGNGFTVSSTQLNAFQFSLAAGNFVSGTVNIYGM